MIKIMRFHKSTQAKFYWIRNTRFAYVSLQQSNAAQDYSFLIRVISYINSL